MILEQCLNTILISLSVVSIFFQFISIYFTALLITWGRGGSCKIGFYYSLRLGVFAFMKDSMVHL